MTVKNHTLFIVLIDLICYTYISGYTHNDASLRGIIVDNTLSEHQYKAQSIQGIIHLLQSIKIKEHQAHQ